MNSDIVLQGVTETVNGATITAAVNTPILLLLAHTDVVINAITYLYPPTTPNAGAVTAFTLPQGGYLFNVKSITFTGYATLTYRHKAA